MRADGTIDRAAAPAIVNPCDLHALEAARALTKDITAITMGPAGAVEALRQAVAHGATAGALVTDRSFAGSDTWATANVLAAAVRALGGFDVILCGLTAIDGETGQVGPQVAQRLGIPQATGCEHLEIRGERLVARRIVEGGYEVISLPMPSLVTVTETGNQPAYPTLPMRRRAGRAEFATLTAADIGVSGDEAGLEASPTKVANMKAVSAPPVATRYVDGDLSYAELAARLHLLARRDGQPLVPPVAKSPRGAQASPPRQGPLTVLVVAEAPEGHLSAGSAELLTKARELAGNTGGTIGAFLAGAGLKQACEEAALFGADLVFLAEDVRLSRYTTLPHARVLHDAVERHQPDIVLMSATSVGRDLAPRVAAMLDTGLAADCTGLSIGDWTRRGTKHRKLLHQVRPAMGSSVLATCISPTARPQMATVRPGTFQASQSPSPLHIVPVAVRLDAADLCVEILEHTTTTGDVRLVDADVIVAGGAGCTAENWHLVEELADRIGGKVAASRAAVDAGLAPRALQVGQTGKTVAPAVYIACGISGALQHTVGMHAAETVVAINRDPDAAIFTRAHFGIVGDVADVLPRLTEELARLEL